VPLHRAARWGEGGVGGLSEAIIPESPFRAVVLRNHSTLSTVTPAKAGGQGPQALCPTILDPGLRRGDGSGCMKTNIPLFNVACHDPPPVDAP
jgi:hypothetical protein